MPAQSVTVATPGRLSRHNGGLARMAYATILQRIAQGDFAPGEIISRRRVATELGISFLPASEALLRLEWDGLLERRPRAGTRLRFPVPEDVRQHFVVCEALEAQAAILFAERSTATDRSEVFRLARRVDRHANQQDLDPSAFPALHQKLHLRIAECARCDALLEAIGRASALSSAWLGGLHDPGTGQPQARHVELVEILATETPALAAQAMRLHIRSDGESLMRGVEPYLHLHEQFKETYRRTLGKAPRAAKIPGGFGEKGRNATALALVSPEPIGL